MVKSGCNSEHVKQVAVVTKVGQSRKQQHDTNDTVLQKLCITPQFLIHHVAQPCKVYVVFSHQYVLSYPTPF